MEVDENNAAPPTDTLMEVDEDTSGENPTVNPTSAVRIMASSGTVGSVSISLHPLVIMNVGEHWTRLRAQEGSDQLGICFISMFVVSSVTRNIFQCTEQ